MIIYIIFFIALFVLSVAFPVWATQAFLRSEKRYWRDVEEKIRMKHYWNSVFQKMK